MATDQVVQPEEGEDVYRMADGPLNDEKGRALKNTTGNVVDFEVLYPKEYKGVKYMKDGDVHKLHVVHADALVEKGLGKIKK